MKNNKIEDTRIKLYCDEDDEPTDILDDIAGTCQDHNQPVYFYQFSEGGTVWYILSKDSAIHSDDLVEFFESRIQDYKRENKMEDYDD